MDNVWIGRKLTGASDALTTRYQELTLQAGEASALVAALAPGLLREIGRSLTLGEQDPRLPFTRVTGLLRIPSDIEESMLARAWNGLAALASSYVIALPGATGKLDRFTRDAVRHAAKVTLQFRRELLLDQRRARTEALFGGTAMLVYPRRQSVAV